MTFIEIKRLPILKIKFFALLNNIFKARFMLGNLYGGNSNRKVCFLLFKQVLFKTQAHKTEIIIPTKYKAKIKNIFWEPKNAPPIAR